MLSILGNLWLIMVTLEEPFQFESVIFEVSHKNHYVFNLNLNLKLILS